MKPTTYLTTSLLLILMAFQGKVFAQTYYPVYLCGNATVTFVPTGTFGATDQVIWKDTYQGSTTTVLTTTGATPNLTTAAGLAVGAHSYTVTIISAAGGCEGDPSDPYNIYKLPASTIALATPTVANYCENGTPLSVIVADVTPAEALPAGITMNYNWIVTKTVNATVTNPASTSIGSHAITNGTLKNTFTMNTTSVGAYNFAVEANYVVSAGGGTLRSGDNAGCAITAPDTRNVTVSPKPTKPTITIL